MVGNMKIHNGWVVVVVGGGGVCNLRLLFVLFTFVHWPWEISIKS